MNMTRATILSALIAAAAVIAAAFISQARQASPSPEPGAQLECTPIPPSANLTPAAREGFVWIPTDFRLESGAFVEVSGHWERKRADGRDSYVLGHWDTSSGRCIWIEGERVAAGE